LPPSGIFFVFFVFFVAKFAGILPQKTQKTQQNAMKVKGRLVANGCRVGTETPAWRVCAKLK
jgi:hypothetical protein